MQGQYRLIAGRPTYFPPFVNELFGDTPYWSCTFASLLNGVNVGWRGEQPATVGEIKALAQASGDNDLKGGSQSSHMVSALNVRYGKQLVIRHLPPARVARRLGHGWAMVAGITYGRLPKHYRRWSPYFKDGHRVVLIGWNNGRTKILDPMADRDATFTGEWIQWSDFEPAWWSREQLWFREGMFLPQPTLTPPSPLDEPRPWSAARGSTLDLLSPIRAGVVVRRIRVGTASRALFDAQVGITQARPAKGRPQPLIRISSGNYRGLLLDPTTDGVRADLSGAATVAEAKADVKADASVTVTKGHVKGDPIKQARRDEWDRIHKALGPIVNLPPRP